jgi:hypothetical protein
MRQIKRNTLLQLISDNKSEYIVEQAVHVMFLSYGEDLDKKIEELNKKHHEEK